MESQVFIILFLLSNLINVWCLVETDVAEFQNQLNTLDAEQFGSECQAELIASFANPNEDANLNIFQYMAKYDLPYQTFTVTTGSGYKIQLVRIPGNGPVLFVNHGFLGSFADFLTSGTVSGLGFLLRNAGYDIWFINCRGNFYSRVHATLSPEQEAFWRFSWHEIGVEDLPKCIDFVLNTTGKTKLTYIGYSQGTTTGLVLLAKKPEYNQKLQAFILLAPVAYVGNIQNPLIRTAAKIADQIQLLSSLLGQYEFLPKDGLIAGVKDIVCYPSLPLCNNVVYLINGFNCDQLNFTAVPVQYSKVPAGASFRQATHYLQLVKSNEFTEYDFGAVENFVKYQSLVPPKYNLQNVVAPVAIFRADGDRTANPTDVARLVSELPNVVENYLVPDEDFDHLDFAYAKFAKPLLYDRVLTVIATLQN